MQKSQRIESVDFWRGVALITIFIDHVPGNLLAGFTPRNFGFSDSAEAFVFLSGVALAAAYWPKFVAGDRGRVVMRCLRRAAQIYATHLGLCAAFLLIFSMGYVLTREPRLLDDDARNLFFDHPLDGAFGLVTLGYQFGYVNILPVYVAILCMAPALMTLLCRNLWLGLAVSATLYLAAQVGLSFPSWPWPDTWFLNPFAWQFIFTLGMITAIRMRGAGIPSSGFLLGVSALVVLFALFIETDGFGFVSGLSAGVDTRFAANKQLLGAGRLVHFAGLAYLLGEFGVAAFLLRFSWAKELARLGRHSLTIFAAGTIACALGQLILDLCDSMGNPVLYETIGLSIVVLGTVSLVFVAQFVEWKKAKSAGRLDAHPAASAGAQHLLIS